MKSQAQACSWKPAVSTGFPGFPLLLSDAAISPELRHFRSSARPLPLPRYSVSATHSVTEPNEEKTLTERIHYQISDVSCSDLLITCPEMMIRLRSAGPEAGTERGEMSLLFHRQAQHWAGRTDVDSIIIHSKPSGFYSGPCTNEYFGSNTYLKRI
jgi:hypothetical protein